MSRWKPTGWGQAATLFISFTSLRLYEEAIPRLFQPSQTEYQNLGLALGVIVVSMLLAAVPLVRLFRERQRGASAKAQLMELINDELGLIAALAGTVLLLWGWPIADPIAAVVVATIIAYRAVGLFRENASYLLGRSPGLEYLERVERIARSVPGVVDVRDLRAEYIGPNVVHAGMYLQVRPDLTVEDANWIAGEVHRRVHDADESGYCVIQVEPARATADTRRKAGDRPDQLTHGAGAVPMQG